MRGAILAFAVGVFFLQLQAVLPSGAALAVQLAGAGTLLGVVWLGQRRLLSGISYGLCLFAAAVLGFTWAGWRAQLRMAEALPSAWEGVDIPISGTVSGLPDYFERGVRFAFNVDTVIPVQGRVAPVPQHITLAWYQRRQIIPFEQNETETQTAEQREGPADEERDLSIAESDYAHPVHAGERWHFVVRLKRPRGNLNPGGFDYEAWLLQKNIRATGYVRQGAKRLTLAGWSWDSAITRLREAVRLRHQRLLEETPARAVITALAIGDQRGIESAQWAIFARTGITHLMSISGLHVTMFAALAYAVTIALWRRTPRLPLYLAAQKAAAASGFFAAWAYALLAGFEIPAQRTLYMLALVAWSLWRGYHFAPSRVLSVALFVVLLWDPWAVLAAGFWLSFAAVALLFYIGSGRLAFAHWLHEWGRAQWAMTLGLAPLLLLLFQQVSLVSPLANAFAIPLVSFVITPLALLGSLPLGGPFLWLAEKVSLFLLAALRVMSEYDWAVWQQATAPAWSLVLATVGILWLFLPRGFPQRWLGALAMVPMIALSPERPQLGTLRFTLLDVGQGLAAHIQTAQHDLLFDTGPAYSQSADAGSRIILPYLRGQGVNRLDALIISHRDNDHHGGTASVLQGIPVVQYADTFAGTDVQIPQTTVYRPCRAGWHWQWDGVDFTVLHPTGLAMQQEGKQSRNNGQSCVLKVTAGGESLLLTGDLETEGENRLLAQDAQALRATVLVVAHHGSKTSSSAPFLAAVGPRLALVPVGYRNRFGHPKPEVLARLNAAGAQSARTDWAGALQLTLPRANHALTAQRRVYRRYWLDAPAAEIQPEN